MSERISASNNSRPRPHPRRSCGAARLLICFSICFASFACALAMRDADSFASALSSANNSLSSCEATSIAGGGR